MSRNSHDNPYASPLASNDVAKPAPKGFRWRIISTVLATLCALCWFGGGGTYIFFAAITPWDENVPMELIRRAMLGGCLLILAGVLAIAATVGWWKGRWRMACILSVIAGSMAWASQLIAER